MVAALVPFDVTMRAPRWSIRLTALCVLLLQVIAQGALPLADAATETRGGAPGAHVESQSQEGCASGHDHSACVICRSLQAVASPSRGDGGLVLAAALSAASPADDARSPRATPHGPTQPRAPPLA